MYRPIQAGPPAMQRSSGPVGHDSPSPISNNHKLGARRGRITAVACEPCKTRKSKCNGLKPMCNTCIVKRSTCKYDMMQEQRWQGTSKMDMKRLERENKELKSILPLIALTSQRDTAAKLALEIQEHGFSEYSSDEVRRILQGQVAGLDSCTKQSAVTEKITHFDGEGESFWHEGANKPEPGSFALPLDGSNYVLFDMAYPQNWTQNTASYPDQTVTHSEHPITSPNCSLILEDGVQQNFEYVC